MVNNIILGLIQGITEFLPISSSGHLYMAQVLFGMNISLPYEILLHIATLLSILIMYRNDIYTLLIGISKGIQTRTYNEEMRFSSFIILSTLITVVLVYPFKDTFEELMITNIQLVMRIIGICLCITGAFLWLSSYINKRIKQRYYNTVSSILVGIAQSISILPGLSRSGTTVSTLLMTGIEYNTALKISMFLNIPIITAATLLMLIDGDFSALNTSDISIYIGFIISFIAGVCTIYVLKTIGPKIWNYWKYYCIMLGIVLIYMY